MTSSTLLAVLFGTWVGVLGAIRRYSLADYLATIGAMVALSIPTFWFGLVMIYLFSVWLGDRQAEAVNKLDSLLYG